MESTGYVRKTIDLDKEWVLFYTLMCDLTDEF